jgi:hypothetical protein
MQDIVEMITLLRVHRKPWSSGQPATKSKLQKLHDGIGKGKYKSDAEAAKNLYGEDAEGSKFRKLKSDLRDKLHEAVLQLQSDPNDASDYQNAYYESHRTWLVVRTLIGQGAHQAATTLVRKLLRQTEKFDFTLLNMDIYSFLRIQYGLRERNEKKYLEANQSYNWYQAMYTAENMAEEQYTRLMLSFVGHRSSAYLIADEIKATYELLREPMATYPSYRLQMYGRMIGFLHYTAQGDYAAASRHCAESILFFEKKPYEAKLPLQIFHYNQVISCIYLRVPELGESALAHGLRAIPEGSFNWFKNHEMLVYLSLYARSYQRAADTVSTLIQHVRFDALSESTKELWWLFEAYMHFLLAQQPSWGPLVPFRLKKFMTSEGIFLKDKSGINVAIILVRLLLDIQENNTKKLHTLVKATEQYCTRYLQHQAEMFRTYKFLQLVSQLARAGQQRAAFEAAVHHADSCLRSAEWAAAPRSFSVEIIPYEDLWQILTERMQAHLK